MVDITKTRAQLLERAGIALGLVQPGEALSSEDSNTLDNLVDPLIEQLTADSIIYISDADAIDVAVFLPLASVLANYAGPSFGSPINDAALLRDQGTLRRINSTLTELCAAHHGLFLDGCVGVARHILARSKAKRGRGTAYQLLC
jgi:hypothetical protein